MLLFGCFLVPMVLATMEKPFINNHYIQKSILKHDEWFNESSTLSLNRNPYGSAKLMDTLLLGQSVYNISQALFECNVLLDDKNNETEFRRMVKKMNSLETMQQSVFGVGISEKYIAQSNDIPRIKKNVKVKICIHQRRLTLLEVFKKGEVLRSDCKELKVNLARHSISLRRFGISSFAKGWYRLHSLPINFLDLGNNDIVNVTSELFNDLPADLSSVSLADNQIERLDKGIIFNKNLRQLNLDNNFISYIADGALRDTTLLRLFVSANQLTNTRFVATLPYSLMEIILSENQIQEISPRSFARLNNLKHLSFAQNNITEITTESLRGLLSLKRLILVENNLKTMKPGIFNDLKALMSLNLYQNKLTNLGKGIFDNSKNLKYLNIGFNKFEKISPDFLRGLPYTLQVLYLDFNRINTLEWGTFVDVPKYRLSLKGNKITTIEKGSFNLPHLQELNLDANSLSILNGDAFHGLENLRLLTLKKNCIKKIVNFFFWRNRMLRLKSGHAAVFLNCQRQKDPFLKCQ